LTGGGYLYKIAPICLPYFFNIPTLVCFTKIARLAKHVLPAYAFRVGFRNIVCAYNVFSRWTRFKKAKQFGVMHVEAEVFQKLKNVCEAAYGCSFSESVAVEGKTENGSISAL
jgi:hypothetical protein